MEFLDEPRSRDIDVAELTALFSAVDLHAALKAAPIAASTPRKEGAAAARHASRKPTGSAASGDRDDDAPAATSASDALAIAATRMLAEQSNDGYRQKRRDLELISTFAKADVTMLHENFLAAATSSQPTLSTFEVVVLGYLLYGGAADHRFLASLLLIAPPGDRLRLHNRRIVEAAGVSLGALQDYLPGLGQPLFPHVGALKAHNQQMLATASVVGNPSGGAAHRHNDQQPRRFSSRNPSELFGGEPYLPVEFGKDGAGRVDAAPIRDGMAGLQQEIQNLRAQLAAVDSRAAHAAQAAQAASACQVQQYRAPSPPRQQQPHYQQQQPQYQQQQPYYQQQPSPSRRRGGGGGRGRGALRGGAEQFFGADAACGPYQPPNQQQQGRLF